MSSDGFASRPWQTFSADFLHDSHSPSAFHKTLVPYTQPHRPLQTLSIWVPTTTATIPSSSAFPTRPGPWVVFIHGGAWRDPLVTAATFTSTVRALLSNPFTRDHIGGLASIDYRLSKHEHHAKDPSPPKEGSKTPRNEDRLVEHPAHIQDVLHALEFLQQKAKFGTNYLLVGHSCGATLALQSVLSPSRWTTSSTSISIPSNITKPRVVLGVNGLYNLPILTTDVDESYEELKSVYSEFINGAYGSDQNIWRTASPSHVTAEEWRTEWPEGGLVILAQSRDDHLVPYSQTEELLRLLKTAGKGDEGSKNAILVKEAKVQGEHNECWQTGELLAEVIAEGLKAFS